VTYQRTSSALCWNTKRSKTIQQNPDCPRLVNNHQHLLIEHELHLGRIPDILVLVVVVEQRMKLSGLAGPVPDKLSRHLNRENVYILVVAHSPGIPSGSLLTALAEQKSELLDGLHPTADCSN